MLKKILMTFGFCLSISSIAMEQSIILTETNTPANRNRNCLLQASNEELLDEVYSRMSFRQENPPRFREDSVTMEAFCSSSNYLVYTVYQSATKEKLSSDQIYLGNRCSSIASFIYQRYSKGIIYPPARFAFCDNSNYLVRATVDKLGKINFEDKTYVGNFQSCEKAAEISNQN